MKKINKYPYISLMKKFMHKMRLLFVLSLIMIIAITACNNSGGGNNKTGNGTSSSNDISEIESYLADYIGGENLNDLVPLKVTFNLGIMTNIDSNWQKLLIVIADKGKYVALDLSECTMQGTVFEPDYTVDTGKDKIVSMILPDVAEIINEADDGTSGFRYFNSFEKIEGKNITIIGKFAFSKCNNLKDIDFPNTTNIGAQAFGACKNLKNAIFPKATTIDIAAFIDCYNLENAIFPKANIISSSAFNTCKNMKTISFPEATSIGNSTFRTCYELKSIEFPKVTFIDNEAFAACTNLESVNFQEAQTISENAFGDCSKLESISFPNVISIENYAFNNCPLVSITIAAGCSMSDNTMRGDFADYYTSQSGNEGTYTFISGKWTGP